MSSASGNTVVDVDDGLSVESALADDDVDSAGEIAVVEDQAGFNDACDLLIVVVWIIWMVILSVILKVLSIAIA